MITSNFSIPATATGVTFQVPGRGKFQYHFWYAGPSKWAWSALGNCGEEISSDRAQEAARLWIRDGVKSLRPYRKEL